MRLLLQRPHNTNQLAEALELDYTTVMYHLRVLERNGLVVGRGPNYGHLYYPTVQMEEAADAFRSIWENLETDDAS